MRRAHRTAAASGCGRALVVLPISIPDFIVGYAWHSLSPGFIGLRAAAVVMTLDLYPLVYLPVAAALRRSDPSLEETGAQPSVLGRLADVQSGCCCRSCDRRCSVACLVVMLALLAEYGAFEILSSFQTFTTEIFAEFKGRRVCGLCAVTVAGCCWGIVVLLGEAHGHLWRRQRVSRGRSQASRPPVRPSSLGCGADGYRWWSCC